MGLASSLTISGSALTAQRLRMDVISSNIANAESTQTGETGAFKRNMVVFAPATATLDDDPQNWGRTTTPQPQGVQVAAIVQDDSPPRLEYKPEHPDADADGYVAYPNVNLVTEMVDMLSATRAYEASVTALNAAKTMAQRALEIGRG